MMMRITSSMSSLRVCADFSKKTSFEFGMALAKIEPFSGGHVMSRLPLNIRVGALILSGLSCESKLMIARLWRTRTSGEVGTFSIRWIMSSTKLGLFSMNSLVQKGRTYVLAASSVDIPLADARISMAVASGDLGTDFTPPQLVE